MGRATSGWDGVPDGTSAIYPHKKEEPLTKSWYVPQALCPETEAVFPLPDDQVHVCTRYKHEAANLVVVVCEE